MRNECYKSNELMKLCDNLSNTILPFMCTQLGNMEGMLVMRLASYLLEFRNKGLI